MVAVWGGCRVASGATHTNVYGKLISSTYTYIRTTGGFKLPHKLSNKFNVYVYKIENRSMGVNKLSNKFNVYVYVYNKGV